MLLQLSKLQSYLDKFEIYLDNAQKARVYTNIAFNHDYTEETLEYLLKAKYLDSPFVEIYTGLGLYYFSMYQSNEDIVENINLCGYVNSKLQERIRIRQLYVNNKSLKKR